MILSEIDGISRFNTEKTPWFAGLAPTTSSSGGKTYHGKMIRSCSKWLKGAFVDAAWVAAGCDPYFGGIYRRSSLSDHPHLQNAQPNRRVSAGASGAPASVPGGRT